MIFLSSVVGEMGNAGQTAYAASKAALLGVTKSMAREYASRNITVNAITPGFIDTDMTGALTDDQKDGHQLRPSRSAAPASREEIAAAVVYLCLGRGRLHHRPGAARQRRHVHVNLGVFRMRADTKTSAVGSLGRTTESS